jgi:hypothetical protein
MPEVPSVDVALDLDPIARADRVPQPEPLPPELVGVIPVAPDAGPAPSATPAPPTPTDTPTPTPVPPAPAGDAGSPLFARRPVVRSDDPPREDVPSPAQPGPHGPSDADEDDGVRRLFRRRPRL